MPEPYVETLETIGKTELVQMPRQPRLTMRQLDFLRNLRKHPHSLPLMTWPRATTLRKWMRRPRFRAAIETLEEALAVESRLLMAGAAASAAMHLQSTLTGGTREHSGTPMDPATVSLYAKSTKQCLGVLWAEMTRRETAGRANLRQELLKRMAAAPGKAEEEAPDDIL